MKIKVDTTKLRECGNDIISEANGINEAIEKIFLRISNMSTNTKEWVGVSADEFIKKANFDKAQYVNFKEDLANMGELLVEIASTIESDVKHLEDY